MTHGAAVPAIESPAVGKHTVRDGEPTGPAALPPAPSDMPWNALHEIGHLVVRARYGETNLVALLGPHGRPGRAGLVRADNGKPEGGIVPADLSTWDAAAIECLLVGAFGGNAAEAIAEGMPDFGPHHVLSGSTDRALAWALGEELAKRRRESLEVVLNRAWFDAVDTLTDNWSLMLELTGRLAASGELRQADVPELA